jgi:D-alanine--poly(phosphoribitol) ligase subunit 2
MEEKLLDLLEEICEDDVVREERDMDLFAEGYMDSFGYTELLVGIEDQFGIVLAPSEIAREDVATVNKIIALVESRSA